MRFSTAVRLLLFASLVIALAPMAIAFGPNEEPVMDGMVGLLLLASPLLVWFTIEPEVSADQTGGPLHQAPLWIRFPFLVGGPSGVALFLLTFTVVILEYLVWLRFGSESGVWLSDDDPVQLIMGFLYACAYVLLPVGLCSPFLRRPWGMAIAAVACMASYPALKALFPPGPREPRTLTELGDPWDMVRTVLGDGTLIHYARDDFAVLCGLAPVVDVFSEEGPYRVALFGSSLEPVFFQALEGTPTTAWRMGRRVRLEPGQALEMKAYLLLHTGDATRAWAAFHQFAHQEDFQPIEWTREFRAHYYDFLSAAGAEGPRGGGYDADLEHFGAFHIGMATQHGYYLSYGDFIHPDRKEWPAMPGDPRGPVPMSLEKVRARVDATRRAGVHPMIYLHYTILDEGSPLFEEMKDSRMVDASGEPVSFGWRGPDVIEKTWKMSVASPIWRDHLVQQAHWVMELLDPDGIVLDETFTAWGYDHHPDRTGPTSAGGIELMRRLRATVRSFGPDKALFASDFSMGNLCLWGDGEGGDHCYDRLLGNPLYRRTPVRYMAPLGDKPWQPCAWLFKSLWPAQVDLARKVGAGVGLTNGWGDNIGLARLPEEIGRHMIRDIESLLSS